MPSNLTPVRYTYELDPGPYTVIQVADLTDAIYYAAGRRGYVYESVIIDQMYLILPVLPKETL